MDEFHYSLFVIILSYIIQKNTQLNYGCGRSRYFGISCCRICSPASSTGSGEGSTNPLRISHNNVAIGGDGGTGGAGGGGGQGGNGGTNNNGRMGHWEVSDNSGGSSNTLNNNPVQNANGGSANGGNGGDANGGFAVAFSNSFNHHSHHHP